MLQHCDWYIFVCRHVLEGCPDDNHAIVQCHVHYDHNAFQQDAACFATDFQSYLSLCMEANKQSVETFTAAKIEPPFSPGYDRHSWNATPTTMQDCCTTAPNDYKQNDAQTKSQAQWQHQQNEHLQKRRSTLRCCRRNQRIVSPPESHHIQTNVHEQAGNDILAARAQNSQRS